MDIYKVIVTKNKEEILSSESAFPSFVGEDHSIRFATLELVTKILEEHPVFGDDIYELLVKHREKIIQGVNEKNERLKDIKCNC